MNNNYFNLACAALLSIAIFGAGFCIGKGFYFARLSNKTLTVKGLTERDVTSDLGIWEINYRETGNNLIELNKKLLNDQQMVFDFLIKRGFKTNEISLQTIKLEDKVAYAYQTTTTAMTLDQRYILTGGIRIRSQNTALIKTANQALTSLLELGVPIFDSGNLNPNPSYYYTKLDEIRPTMMAEATKSAKSVADQFAKDSSTTLAGIQRANQGVFQIMGRDTSTLSADWSNTQSALGSIDKKVRLVNTVEYRIQ